jgi:hypothetical protein
LSGAVSYKMSREERYHVLGIDDQACWNHLWLLLPPARPFHKQLDGVSICLSIGAAIPLWPGSLSGTAQCSINPCERDGILSRYRPIQVDRPLGTRLSSMIRLRSLGPNEAGLLLRGCDPCRASCMARLGRTRQATLSVGTTRGGHVSRACIRVPILRPITRSGSATEPAGPQAINGTSGVDRTCTQQPLKYSKF